MLPHFWFYSVLTAPFFAGARALGVNPLLAFTAANTVLLAIAAWAIARRYRAITVALLLAGPIIWWIDKAHTEVFAYALITITVTMLPTRSIVSLLAAAVLAAQNPQALGFFACVSAWLLFRWRTSLPPPHFLGTLVGVTLAVCVASSFQCVLPLEDWSLDSSA